MFTFIHSADDNSRGLYYQACPYTLCPKKTCDYIFYNNFNNKCPITIIFGIDLLLTMPKMIVIGHLLLK